MWVMISGPYTAGARTPEDRARNLEAMNLVALEVLERGHTPIIGVNLALPLVGAAGAEHFERIMMPVSLAAAERCDCVIRIGGASAGADQEVESFTRRGLPVFTSTSQLPPPVAHIRPSMEAAEKEMRRYRGLAEKAAAQLQWPQLRIALDPETNSIAVIMKHMAGNLRSRWTDFLTTDGEKPWRDRDAEFVDDFADRAALEAWWLQGWTAFETAAAALTDAELARVVHIRGEPHTVALALARSLAHTAYHTGQITQLARSIASRQGQSWATLTVPRGGSKDHNLSMGYGPPAAPQ